MTGVDGSEVVLFSRQLATMVTAGLPLTQAIGIIGEQNDDPAFKGVVFQLRDDIAAGAKFPEALAKHPTVFSDFYVQISRAGDIGGNLDVILDRLAYELERANAYRTRYRVEVVTPLLLALGSTMVGLGLIGMVTHEHVWPLAGVVGVACLVVLGFMATAKSATLKKLAVARFARILGTLQSSGVPILDGLDITARCLGSGMMATALLEARAKIKEGEEIAGPLKATGAFPAMVIQMISAGQETGKLDQMLLKIADFYEAEVEAETFPARLPTWCLIVGVALLVQGLTLVLVLNPLLEAGHPA